MEKMLSDGNVKGGFCVARGTVIPGILQDLASYHPEGLGDRGLGGCLEKCSVGMG